jgi:hypothetical protein
MEQFRVLTMEVMGSSADDVTLTCVSAKRQDERKTLSYLPNRPPVDIEFTDLSYTVPQGRKGKPQSSDLTAYPAPSITGPQLKI